MAKTWNTLRTIINRKRTLHHKLTFNDDGKKYLIINILQNFLINIS